MELKILTLEGSEAGSVDLPASIFGLEPRTDILHRCVRWQLAKRQRGTHDVKNRGEISLTGKKLYRQKGTGSARHGPRKVNLFRDGGIIVLDKANLKDGKTKELRTNFAKLGLTSALIIDGAEIDAKFALAARNIANIDVLPVQGINVYDILRRHTLVLTKSALDALEARLK